MFFKHRDHHRESAAVHSTCFAFSAAEKSSNCKCLNFCKQHATACHHGHNCSSWSCIGCIRRSERTFVDFGQSFASHFEESDLVSRTKAILACTNEAVCVMTITFERENDINKMFEQLWSSEVAFLCDMADDHHDCARCLCELHEFHATSAKLGHRSRQCICVMSVDELNAVDGKHRRTDSACFVGDSRN